MMNRKILSVLCAVLMVCVLAVSVCADETLGSISITMAYRGTSVPGGTMTLYHVGVCAEDHYEYTAELAGCGVSLDDLSAARTAQDIADYVVAMGIEGVTKEIDDQGVICFDDLEFGLYLMVQETAAEGYSVVSPFLVTVDGDVDASPKLSVEPVGTQPPETTAPPETTETTEPEPTEPKLPQTGQLNWPVPLLAVGGLVIFVLGWYLRRKEA